MRRGHDAGRRHPRPAPAQAVLQKPLLPSPPRHLCRRAAGPLSAAVGRANEAAGRCLHQDDQMIIAPIIFCTVVHGIASMQDMRKVPVAGIALILGVDRFMSEARALTNLIGNGVARLVVSRWEGALDNDRRRRLLDSETDADVDEPERVLDVLSPSTPLR